MEIFLLFILIISNCMIIYLLYTIKVFLLERKEVVDDVKEYKEFYYDEKKSIKNNGFFNDFHNE